MSDIVTDRRLAQAEREIEQLKSEINRAPLRIETPLPQASAEIHKAFCKTDAPAATTIDCYLDEDDPESEVIQVHCTVASQPKSIEAITLSSPINIKITAHRFVDDVTVRLASIVGISPSLNGEYIVTKADADNFTLNGKAIEDIVLSGTSPVSIKLASHQFDTNANVTLADIEGITPSLDGNYVITKIDDDNFTLNGTDSSNYEGTFTSGAAMCTDYTGTFVSGTACGVDLDESIPRLTIGLEISIWKDGGIWKCVWGFQHWEPAPECP